MDYHYDIVGIGNAIVDVLAQVPHEFLDRHGLVPGSMTLIEADPASRLLASMGSTQTVSGGSAANTVIGAARLGCSAAFIGRVRNDSLGDDFARDIERAGVTFTVPPSTEGPSTGRCFVLVTPDGQRTMNTFLGACQDLDEGDVDEAMIAGAAYTYLEGYLWDPPGAKAAFRKAARIAHERGRKVALSLSDAFCVERYRDEFLKLIRDGTVDLVFANEVELASLYRQPEFDRALASLRSEGVLAVVTRSEKGCVVLDGADTIAVPAAPTAAVVDTTGAGDLFAAGFVTGLVRHLPLRDCARLGALAAAEIIQHIGARPVADLRQIAEADGLSI